MNIETDGLQLYSVDFNDGNNFFSSGKGVYHVMARSYDEAVLKAEKKNEESISPSIIGADGSLNLSEEKEMKARVVKLISDEIVW